MSARQVAVNRRETKQDGQLELGSTWRVVVTVGREGKNRQDRAKSSRNPCGYGY